MTEEFKGFVIVFKGKTTYEKAREFYSDIVKAGMKHKIVDEIQILTTMSVQGKIICKFTPSKKR